LRADGIGINREDIRPVLCVCPHRNNNQYSDEKLTDLPDATLPFTKQYIQTDKPGCYGVTYNNPVA
jgi:hypothetical protein